MSIPFFFYGKIEMVMKMKKWLLLFLCLMFVSCAKETMVDVAAITHLGILPYVDFRSSIDKDQDGVDDANGIIQTVRDYIATDPIYKSVYYGGGYPNDGYGVCTDVVAFGLLGAGYDLMHLVDTHVRNNRDLYDIEYVDANIDFRRVNNLLIFFRHNFIELTVDPTAISEWKPGDIIVMDGHVGIVSDKRTAKGIPLVIHHTEKDPHIREENLIETRDDIVAHFRVSN